MIAADTSSVVAFMVGETAPDVQAVRQAIVEEKFYLPPVVLTELLSGANISAKNEKFILDLPVLHVLEGFWWRAAKSRANLLERGLRAKLGDTLIAQSCIDHDVPLITRDKDFRHYAKHCGLRLYDA